VREDLSRLNTSHDDGFEIFTEVCYERFDSVNSNQLKLFMLDTENRLFNYPDLYIYIRSHISRYVYNRKRIRDTENSEAKQIQIFLDAIDHLKSVEEKDGKGKDRGAGAELGEILLYLFLEKDLKAPKLLSKVEFKTSPDDYIKGCDAIHFRFREKSDGSKVFQIVVGEAKIYDKVLGTNGALTRAFVSIKNYIENPKQDLRLLDSHVQNEFVDEGEARIIKSYLVSSSSQKKETVFGVFIGYTSPYSDDTVPNDTFDTEIIEKNKTYILSLKDQIISEISKHEISNYQFNFYFLPFHNAMKDRKHIIKLLKEKQGQYYDRGRLDE